LILQKCDNAEAANVQNSLELSDMKTRYMKIDWLIPLAGIAVVAGSLLAATTYLDLNRKIRACETFGATVDRLFQDQKLSTALKAIHDGKVDGAAQRLDLLLCQSIVQLNSELASADPRTRAYVEDAFRRIARLRPKADAAPAGSPDQERSDDQIAAEKILTLALAGDHSTQTK
jgi:hypothetical protein